MPSFFSPLTSRRTMRLCRRVFAHVIVGIWNPSGTLNVFTFESQRKAETIWGGLVYLSHEVVYLQNVSCTNSVLFKVKLYLILYLCLQLVTNNHSQVKYCLKTFFTSEDFLKAFFLPLNKLGTWKILHFKWQILGFNGK